MGLYIFPQAEARIQTALSVSRAEYGSFLLSEWKKQGPQAAAALPAEQRAETAEVIRLLAAKAPENGWSANELEAISAHIVTRSHEYNVSPFFVLSLIEVESEFQNQAVSSRGARGLMQLMPATAERLADQFGLRWQGPDSLNDPLVNIDLGLRYVQELRTRFDSPKNVLIAYNIGPAALQRKLKNGERLPTGYYRRIMHARKGYQREQSAPDTTLWL